MSALNVALQTTGTGRAAPCSRFLAAAEHSDQNGRNGRGHLLASYCLVGRVIFFWMCQIILEKSSPHLHWVAA